MKRCTDCVHLQLDLGWSGYGGEWHLGSVSCDRGRGYFDSGDVGDMDPVRTAEAARRLRVLARQAESCADFEVAP